VRLSSRVVDVLTRAISEAWPDEVCGLIVKRGRVQHFIRLPSTSDQVGHTNLELSELEVHVSREVARAGRVISLVHSHIAAEDSSNEDVEAARRTGLPMAIVVIGPDGRLRARSVSPQPTSLAGVVRASVIETSGAV
jgi:proteasome lid subunit RPN8/RPN11